MDNAIFSANAPGVTAILQGATVFIAGTGGLGSNVAMMLTRAGIGRILIADFDLVSESNLNRQMYTFAQVGKVKVEALKENLLQINPFLRIDAFPVELTEWNFAEFIPDSADLIFECFDNPAAKAALTRFALIRRPSIPYIAVSGIGGVAPLENIRTVQRSPFFYLVGDGESDVTAGHGTIATRVIAAAAAQAHCGIRLLLRNAEGGRDCL